MSERSPWGGFNVTIIPDDDDDARKAGIPDDLIEMTRGDPVVDTIIGRIFVRATLWERIKKEFKAFGSRH